MRTMYVAAVEVATRNQVDIDEAMRTLSDYRPALGTSPRGWVEVQISFPATGLAHACTTAAAIATNTTTQAMITPASGEAASLRARVDAAERDGGATSFGASVVCALML